MANVEIDQEYDGWLNSQPPEKAPVKIQNQAPATLNYPPPTANARKYADLGKPRAYGHLSRTGRSITAEITEPGFYIIPLAGVDRLTSGQKDFCCFYKGQPNSPGRGD